MVLTSGLDSLVRKPQPFQVPGWALKERSGRKGWEARGLEPEVQPPRQAAETGRPGARGGSGSGQAWAKNEGKSLPVRALTDCKEAGGGHLNSCLGRVVATGKQSQSRDKGKGRRIKPAVGWAGRGPLLFRFIRSVRGVDMMHLSLPGLFGGHGRGSPRQELSSERRAASAALAARLPLLGDGQSAPCSRRAGAGQV